jgi:hypothetical protein
MRSWNEDRRSKTFALRGREVIGFPVEDSEAEIGTNGCLESETSAGDELTFGFETQPHELPMRTPKRAAAKGRNPFLIADSPDGR